MSERKGVVYAMFADEAAADDAVTSLKAWDHLDDDVKLSAIGIMVLDEHGKLKVHKVGRRRGIAKGVGIGAIVVVLAGYLITPLGLPVALGVAGATRAPLKPLSAERRAQIAAELESGGAAVGVLVAFEQAAAVSEKLADLGGRTETLELTPELEAAADEVTEEHLSS